MKHTLSVLVENKPGVLTRIAGLFARCGFDIESFVVGESEDPRLNRMTITIDGAAHPVDQVTKQPHKLVKPLTLQDAAGVRHHRDRAHGHRALETRTRCRWGLETGR